VQLDDVRRLPRPLAFVLPGGGALGAYQVGILKALTEAGIEPDHLIGVSAGALNATLYAWSASVDGIAHIEQVWRTVKRSDLLRINVPRILLAFAGLRPSLFDSRPPEQFLRRHIGRRELQHAPIPLAIVATDVETGRPVVVRHGDAASAVVASCSFPAVFPPHQRDGRVLMDGGVVADIPLDIAADLGMASALVLSVPPLAAGAPPRGAIDLLFRASTFGVEAHGRTTLARPPSGLSVIEVHAPPSTVTTFAIRTIGQVVGEGYDATVTWLHSP
jgi:NTE family protein